MRRALRKSLRPRRVPLQSIRKHQRLAAGFLADSFRQFPHGFRNLASPQNLDMDTARAARARKPRLPTVSTESKGFSRGVSTSNGPRTVSCPKNGG